MGKQKPVRRSTLIRMPKPVYDRLLRLRADRSIREGRPVSMNALIVEAVEQSFAKVA